MANWRDSARPVKFWIIDSEATYPMLLWLMHIRLWTFILMISIVGFLSIISRYGFTLTVFLRWFRVFLAGPIKTAKPWWRK